MWDILGFAKKRWNCIGGFNMNMKHELQHECKKFAEYFKVWMAFVV